MKKLLCTVLAITSLFGLVGCVDHNDGVCDKKGCDATIGVEQYDKDHEYCPVHLAEWVAKELEKEIKD